MDQAVGRAVRIGQKEIVEVTLLLLKEEETMNIDEKILEKAESKRGMLEKIFLHASRGLPEQKPEPEAEEAPEEAPEAAPEAEEAPEAREELGPVAAA
jgi:hypothetical protein